MPFLDQPPPLAFAHRGGAAHAPENTWRAFEHAVKLGYRYLETDVRATADGQLVTFHDRTLDRVTGARGPVGAWTYQDLTAVRVAGTEPVPLLEDVLAAWPGIRFTIDLKDVPGVALLPSVLARTGAWDRVCVTSFSGARLRAFRALAAEPVCLGLSPAAIAAVGAGFGRSRQAPPRRELAARDHGQARCAQVPARVASPAFVRRAHALGLQVHVWTVNRRQDMAVLLDRGVDGLITDQTALLRDLLIERGQWPWQRSQLGCASRRLRSCTPGNLVRVSSVAAEDR